MVYFVRVNGATLHNNPNISTQYVPNEPPLYPATKFNYVGFCLENDIIRIGWPDTGDLRETNKAGALSRGYTLGSLKPYVQRYLRSFREIPTGSIILMPDSDNPGNFYMGEVTKPYYYFHALPNEPYECAHRLGVAWDKRANGQFRVYKAETFGIQTQGGGFWRRAFQALDEYESSKVIIPTLLAARQNT